jgi:hypothetical protein
MLNVQDKVIFDESIANYEFRTHAPYSAAALNQNDEIRIPIQHQDICTLPSASFIYIEGKVIVEKKETLKNLKFVSNGILSLFNEIWFELGGVVIDKSRNPGLTSLMKGLVSYNKNESIRLQNAGWITSDDENLIDENGNFCVCIPLNAVLGFAEDFKKVIINLRQELVLRRSNTDNNAILATAVDATTRIELTKVLWKVPHIIAGDVERLRLLDIIEKNTDLNIAFRSWEIHEQPLLQETQRQTWTIKTTTSLERPRYLLIGFQTDRKNNMTKDCSKFDHCNLTNVKLYLNSEIYPYDNLNLNFDNNQFALLYEMYADFQKAYYETKCEPLLSPHNFKKDAPLIVINCNNQKENLRTLGGAVDCRLELETAKNIPPNTACYCVIIHDKMLTYNPLMSIVKIT